MLVGAFRDENLELIQPFLDSMGDLGEPKTIGHRPSFGLSGVVFDTPLENLELGALNSFLASVLSHSTDATAELAELIHRKTAGNPYFVIQLLKQLHAQKILSYNFAALKWEWNIERAIAGTDVSDNVVDVIAARIQRVPTRVQRILKLAACLGFVVDVDILRQLDLCLLVHSRLATQDEEPGHDAQPSGQDSGESSRRSSRRLSQRETYHETQMFEAALKCAEQEGFVERTVSLVKFSHDLIHQGFYDTIGETHSRDALHYEIGRYLKEDHDASKNSNESNHGLLFLAVDQLNRGSSLVDADEERLSLIELICEACQVAKQYAGIEVISYFLHKAIEIIQPSFWLYYYDLILEVYNSSAEVDFSLGMMAEAKATIRVIMVRSTLSSVRHAEGAGR